MSNAIKVLCVFSKPFWPEDFFDLICTGALPIRCCVRRYTCRLVVYRRVTTLLCGVQIASSPR